MRLRVTKREPRYWVGIEELADQILGLLRDSHDIVEELKLARHHFLEHATLVGAVKWELAVEHGVKNDASAP